MKPTVSFDNRQTNRRKPLGQNKLTMVKNGFGRQGHLVHCRKCKYFNRILTLAQRAFIGVSIFVSKLLILRKYSTV